MKQEKIHQLFEKFSHCTNKPIIIRIGEYLEVYDGAYEPYTSNQRCIKVSYDFQNIYAEKVSMMGPEEWGLRYIIARCFNQQFLVPFHYCFGAYLPFNGNSVVLKRTITEIVIDNSMLVFKDGLMPINEGWSRFFDGDTMRIMELDELALHKCVYVKELYGITGKINNLLTKGEVIL